VAGSQIATFIVFPPQSQFHAVSIGGCRLRQRTEYGTWTFFESVELAETFFTGYWAFVLVENHDCVFAHQKARFASDAEVESRRSLKEFAMTLRPDHELMLEARRHIVLRARVFAPEVHDIASPHIPDRRKVFRIQRK
jgi:hypothetical protein